MTSESRGRSLFRQLLRGAVSASLIALIVANIDFGELTTTLADVSLLTIVVLTAIDLALRMFSAFRWYVVFRSTNEDASLGEISRITLVSSFLGQGLPGVVGVEALRIYGLAKARSDWGGAFASVVADRVLGLVSLSLAALLGILIGPAPLREVMLIPVILSLLAVGIVAVVAVIPGARRKLHDLVPDRLFVKISDWLTKVYHCFDHYRSRGVLMFISLLLALAFQLGRVLLFFVAALMLGHQPELVYFVAIVPIVMFLALMPISISGLGVRELGLVYLFSEFDVVPEATAFTIAILVFLSGLLSTLPGGWIYFRNRGPINEMVNRSASSASQSP